jgi:hypothetical protein
MGRKMADGNIGNPFGRLLYQARIGANLTAEDLASNELGLTRAEIARLERSDRPLIRPVGRKVIWHLIEKLNLWPSVSDRLLELGGQSALRDSSEELTFQKSQNCRSLWIFARKILDDDADFFEIVKYNIKREVYYTYFVPSEVDFKRLLNRLTTIQSEAGLPDLKEFLRCYILPEDLFYFNFALYNPPDRVTAFERNNLDRSGMYCCGTKSELGKADSFYTVHETEAPRLYELLSKWKEKIETGGFIYLEAARRYYPFEGTPSPAQFTSDSDMQYRSSNGQ